MKKKLIYLFALVSLVLLFACKQEPPTNSTSGNPFVGSWVDEYNMLKFVFTDNHYNSSSTRKCYLYGLEGNSEILLESYCYKITGNNTCEYSYTTSSGDCYYFYFTLKDSTLYCYSNFYEDMVETPEVIFHKQ